LARAKELQSDLEVIVLTAHGTVDPAVEAMKKGAFDFLQEPVSSPDELRLLVDRALEPRVLLAEPSARKSSKLRVRGQSKTSCSGGASRPSRNSKATARTGPSDATALALQAAASSSPSVSASDRGGASLSADSRTAATLAA